MAELRRKRGHGVELRLDPLEAKLLRDLADEHRSALLSTVDDAVTRRLFPAAYEEEPDEAAYRDLVGDTLRNEKLEALERIAEMLDDSLVVALSGDDLGTWLATIADMRVAIGTRLEVDEITMSAPLDPEDPDARDLALLHWLGAMQHELIEASGGL
jgi:hypothetical protein